MFTTRVRRRLGIRPRLLRRRASHPVAGRLITSPLAFLVAGLLDLGAFWLGWARLRLSGAVRRRRAS
jgi:hypothetical protein